MSVAAAEQVLGALTRVEWLFAVPVLPVEPDPLPQHSALPACSIGREDGDIARLCPPGTTQVSDRSAASQRQEGDSLHPARITGLVMGASPRLASR